MRNITRSLLHLAATLMIIGIGVAGFLLLTASRPQLERTKPPPPMPMVQVVRVENDTRPVLIRGEGTVRPLREIQLVPQVSGEIVYVSPALVDGGAFRQGDVLLRIDPEDYELAVTLAEARVKDSESKLKVAAEEAAVAQEEWRLLNSDNPTADRQPPALVAKEPQLAAARAKLAADRADLKKALLNLERTAIEAPFDGRVSSENVDVGQYVRTTETLATLFSTEAAEIVVPLADEHLYWIDVPGFTPGDGPGSEASVRTRFAGRPVAWQGRVMRAEGKLDERTRLVNVVVRVNDPYASRPPMAAGLFVTVEISGRRLERAALLPRAALRDSETVWVVAPDGILTFRPVKVARLTADAVLIDSGLSDGELVVVSGLKAVTDGMRVRLAGEPGEGAS